MPRLFYSRLARIFTFDPLNLARLLLWTGASLASSCGWGADPLESASLDSYDAMADERTAGTDPIDWPQQPWSGDLSLPASTKPDGVSGLCRRLLLESLPEHYVDQKQWGRTARRWDGLHVHREGLHLKTKRRWKEVNHGVWQRFEITPLDPQQNLHLEISNLHETEPGVVVFDVHLDAPFHAFARRSRWQYGIQLISLSLEADAKAVFDARVELRTKLDPSQLPPDVILQPKIIQAGLRLSDYRVQKISKLGGDLAEDIGDATESFVNNVISNKEQKLVERMNRQIEKNQHKLRLSVRDLVDWTPSNTSP